MFSNHVQPIQGHTDYVQFLVQGNTFVGLILMYIKQIGQTPLPHDSYTLKVVSYTSFSGKTLPFLWRYFINFLSQSQKWIQKEWEI